MRLGMDSLDPKFFGEVPGSRRRTTGPAHLSATFSGSGATARAGRAINAGVWFCGHHIHFTQDTHSRYMFFVNIRLYFFICTLYIYI